MKRRSKTRRSSSESSSEKQEEMAEDGDEPQDLKILKEDPDKTREMSGGGFSSHRLPQLPDQSSEEKTVNPASSSSQMISFHSSETEADFKTKKSPSYFSTYRERSRVNLRTSPSGIDNPFHINIDNVCGVNEGPQCFFPTGVGHKRNKDSEQQTGSGCLLPSDSPSIEPASYESILSSIVDILNRPSDSTDLNFRYLSDSSDIDLNSFSGSRDRLDIEAARFVDIDYQHTLEDIESPDMSDIGSPVTYHQSWTPWTPDPSERRRKSSRLSHSSSSLNQIIPTENTNVNRAASLPNMKLESSFEEFMPDFTDNDDEEDGSYRFQCSGPGLYQCRETGLVFDMVDKGDVFYKTVPWNRRSLSQHHRKPAGPLFDISCEQQSVCRLHLPHCETPSTGRCHFLSVAHINDDGVEFIRPARITETHVIINITGFSAFGNVKDEDSPPDPVRALVLLFYKPPVDPDPEYQINVLMLPKNVVVREVLRFRKQLDGGEMFLETPPHCKLLPKQVYTLSTGPGDDSVLVQPTEAEFDEESYDNYFTAFQVTYEKLMKHIKLFLKDSSSSSVWERRVCLSSSGPKRSCGSTRQDLRPKDLLEEIRISFIDGISEPVLKYLLDKLLQKNVIHDAEKEAILVERERRDKARAVIDTVRKKGDSASSEMITCLCELDPFFCEHLGLK